MSSLVIETFIPKLNVNCWHISLYIHNKQTKPTIILIIDVVCRSTKGTASTVLGACSVHSLFSKISNHNFRLKIVSFETKNFEFSGSEFLINHREFNSVSRERPRSLQMLDTRCVFETANLWKPETRPDRMNLESKKGESRDCWRETLFSNKQTLQGTQNKVVSSLIFKSNKHKKFRIDRVGVKSVLLSEVLSLTRKPSMIEAQSDNKHNSC